MLTQLLVRPSHSFFFIPLGYFVDYFVFWDEKILNHLIHSNDKLTSKARQQLVKLELPARASRDLDKETKFARRSDSNWLSKAQDRML
jgi:hypothetical protein